MSFIALIDYSMGNLSSVDKALAAASGMEVRIVSTPEEASHAAALVLPGVGNFGDGMAHLEKSNFMDFIRSWIADDKPFLGICLGMQMLMESSEEAPGVAGLGIFKGCVKRFPDNGVEKIPHMGWNTVEFTENSPIEMRNHDEKTEPYYYFVHSYYVEPADDSIVSGRTFYIKNYASALGKGRLFATQFHPEKSQNNGLALLKKFAAQIKGEI